MNDIAQTSTKTLRELSEGLRADAKALYSVRKTEAMRLFRLFRDITAEIYRRERMARAPHRYN